ncbi:phage major capsid protein [Ruminococcus sp. NSJ-71]|jgi:HK97 family phage major capsid protein|uniref:Phage major capsid protein n=1 Tax=Ruminococcus intestinalis TaxID=2763066 RepID=A0ABR7HKZ3_9FIRM|nr:phage major capsid protein [Ruminococcus intestinalis]MBC5728152.1 phage major capsid protein [Ruminococcus intestinalis]
MNFIKRMKEINDRKAELRDMLQGSGEVDLDAIEKELRNLDTEYKNLEKRAATIEGINIGTIPAVEIPNPVTARAADTFDQDKEYRSAWLKTLQGKALTENEQRAYSTAAGSALPAIPESTANEIIKKMYEVAPILQRCKIFHVPGNFKFAVEGANNDAAIHQENKAITVAADSLGSVSLTGYEIVKLVKASRATVNMTIAAFESYIVEIIAEAIARKIENFIFVGTGSNQPGGVAQGGKGTNGAYTAGTDMVETSAVTEANITAVYGMLASGYERNAVWAMSKATFFADFYALMNKSKNNLIEFANGRYYIMGCEVYFTGSLAAGVSYLGDFSYIVGNYSQDIAVVKSEHSGLATNSVDYLGSCVFDSKAIAGLGAFVKLVKKAA